MKARTLILLAASAAVLGACGTHSNPSPAIYSEFSIVKDGDDAKAASRRAAQPAQTRQASSSSRAAAAPAPLVPVAMSAASAPVSYAAPAPQRASARTVMVEPGDTVYAIARRTGASPAEIINENRLRAPYTLRVGDTLRIPDPGAKIVNAIEPAQPQEIRIASGGERVHRVRKGDTLYSISRSTGVPVQQLAQANRLRSPYTLEVGQELRVPAASGARQTQREAAAPAAPSAPARDVGEIARTVSYTAPAAAQSAKMFDWPVKGAIIGRFGPGEMGRRNDGVNIAAPIGTPVRAAADGEVVYRGAELEGYGNLLLIKHTDGYVTAYAHNDVMLVKKGDRVRQGQVIAKVGQTGAATEPQLHFEIRQNLKSVDPLAFLDG